MVRADQRPVRLRIVVRNPVLDVLHAMQSKDGHPIAAKRSAGGEPLAFDLAVRVAPGPKVFGDQVRREGPERRFVYVRVGQAAGDPASCWSRRMKIDVHDIEPALLERAAAGEWVVEILVEGTAKDGSPACATVPVIRRRLVGS